MRKAQTFMPDYLASLLVFTAVIAIFITSWNSIIYSQNVFSVEEQLELEAGRTASFLVSTRGYPPDWETHPSDLQVPGFASKDLVLQPDKLLEFKSFSYDRQRKLLKAQNFNLTVMNGSEVMEVAGEKLSFGKPYHDAGTVVPVTRSVAVNTSTGLKSAEFNYIVWSK